MGGFTPFQFSSKMLQEKTTSGLLGGISIGGDAASLIHSAFSWYEMWINPEKVDISTSYIQKPQQTAGSIVTYHYRPDNPAMSVSGKCGWIQLESQESLGINNLLSIDTPNKADAQKSGPFSKKWDVNFDKKEAKRRVGIGAKPTQPGASDNTNNSPRIFLGRLKAIADEPAYYVDYNGIDHYNVKFIKLFTKQFPEGVICEGYYKNFNIPETSDDAQTIDYNFVFTIERILPISFFEQSLGMFGLGSKKDDASTSAIGSMLRSGH